MNYQSTKDFTGVSPRQNPKRHDSPPPKTSPSEVMEQIREVEYVREQVELGEWPTEFLQKGNPSGMGADVPELLKNRPSLGLSKVRPKTCALVVTMDKPFSMGMELADELLSRGYKWKVKRDYVQFAEPDMGYSAFIRDLASANHKALVHVFDVKSYYKKARPEVIAKMPPCVFCVDNYGAPEHATYAAGHGGTSGSGEAVLLKYFDLDAEMKLHVQDACHQFAHWRTLLGVHFWEDNQEGLRIGRKYSS